MNHTILSLLILLLMFPACAGGEHQQAATTAPLGEAPPPVVGAAQFAAYLPALQEKRVGLVVNQTSMVGERHLVDTLLSLGVQVVRILAPEHGFRGNVDRGATVQDDTDGQTGLPIVSIYGKQKKPAPEHLQDLDILIFDIQDVGVRFFTYISTLHYVMEACAEQKLPLLVLDRPNPNGDWVDGPVRPDSLKSFVGLDPLPLLHGCTVGELALMINGEGWLTDAVQCALQVVPVQQYSHQTPYSLPVLPSPNLPNHAAVRLYPALALFEASKWSVGRGTDFPFQVLGYPQAGLGDFSFVPQDRPGVQMNPVQEGETCYGLDLRQADLNKGFTLQYLRWAMVQSEEPVFTNPNWFALLSGSSQLLEQLRRGEREEQIRQSWEPALADYKDIRSKYLLYED